MAMAMSMAPSLAHYDDELRETIVDVRDVPSYHTDPLPNPPFTFPARSSVASPTNIPSRTAHRRPHSAINITNSGFGLGKADPAQISSSNALPDFSFNPGATMSTSPLAKLDSLLSPPISPQSPRMMPPRTGHRRGGSEFVGGEYRSGNAQVEMLGTSPIRSESDASLGAQPTAGTRRRGGHAHRRSAALSSHDLSNIMKATPPPLPSPRGNSAPSSPSADINQTFSFPASIDNVSAPSRQDGLPGKAMKPHARQHSIASTSEDVQQAEPPSKSVTRTRVGFSDTLEFIPRPLSLVSSEASSTATIRPGHSLSGSISSIISISNSIMEEPEEPVFSQEADTTQDGDERPRTAGAILERMPSLLFSDVDPTSPPRRGSLPLLSDVSLLSPTDSNPPTPSPAMTPKRWSFFGLDAFTGSSSSSPTKSRFPSEITAHIPDSPAIVSDDIALSCNEPTGTIPRTPPRKVKKKQIRTKIWGGSILSSKSKARYGKNKRQTRKTPTPPLLKNVAGNQHTSQASEFQHLKSKSAEALNTPQTVDHAAKDWKFPSMTTGDDVTYPMIDLDAALGPFNTPLARNAEWEAAQKAGGLNKRHLHSAAGMSRFGGPGMHYNHQRAQSSPEMAPFEARRSLHRFGSSSTMADVFEEDEEDDEEDMASERSSTKPASTSGRYIRTGSMTSSNPSIRTSAVSSPRDAKSNGPPVSFTTRGLKRRGSDLENEHPWHHTASAKSETSSISIPVDTMAGTFRNVEYGQAITTDEPSQPSSPRATPKAKRLAPVEVGSYTMSSSQTPISPFSSATPSTAYPSPRSAVSSDAQIISTAPSSIAESSYGSLLNGEPGPEVRTSMDVRTPSLMSSTSTMTRESITPRPISQRLARPTTTISSAERPASVMSLGFNNRRGSLASLKRLISSSHGERSKLSVEVTYREEAQEQPKVSKTKRLSRLVQFWKPRAESDA